MKPSVFHVFISDKMKLKCEMQLNDVLQWQEVRAILYNSHLPCNMHNEFLGEMESFGFIKKINKQKIKVLK